jgi:hypothetical protein
MVPKQQRRNKELIEDEAKILKKKAQTHKSWMVCKHLVQREAVERISVYPYGALICCLRCAFTSPKYVTKLSVKDMKHVVDYYVHLFNYNNLPLKDYFLGYEFIPRKEGKGG